MKTKNKHRAARARIRQRTLKKTVINVVIKPNNVDKEAFVKEIMSALRTSGFFELYRSC